MCDAREVLRPSHAKTDLFYSLEKNGIGEIGGRHMADALRVNATLSDLQ